METRSKKALQICCICYEKVMRQGKIDSCNHNFCLQCIKNWAKIENTCPMCKKRFTKIQQKMARISYKNLTTKLQSLDIKQKSQFSDQESITFTIQQLIEGLFHIMETDQQMWNDILTTEGIVINSEWLRSYSQDE